MPITDKLDNVIGKVADIAGTTADYAASGHTIEEKVDYISSLLEGISAGGGSGGNQEILIVSTTDDGYTVTLNNTYQEIVASPLAIMVSELTESESYSRHYSILLEASYSSGSGYYVTFDNIEFFTDSETGYPSFRYGAPDDSPQS